MMGRDDQEKMMACWTKECHHTQIQGSPHQPSSSRFCDSPLGSCLRTSVSTKYLNVVLTISQWDGKNKLLWPPYSRKRKIHLRGTSHQMSMSKTEHCAKEPPELKTHGCDYWGTTQTKRNWQFSIPAPYRDTFCLSPVPLMSELVKKT